MPYTVEDFDRDFAKKHLHLLSLEERLEGLSSEELLKGLSLAKRLEGLSPEELLESLSLDEIRAYLAKLQNSLVRHSTHANHTKILFTA